MLAPGDGGVGGGLQGLLGVAEHEMANTSVPSPDERRALVGLDHHDRHGAGKGAAAADEDVAGDAAAAHAEDHDLLDLLGDR